MFLFFISKAISTISICGNTAVPTRFGISINLKIPFLALAIASKLGVAEPKMTGQLLYFPLNIAISIALYLGLLSCLKVSLCSSSNTIKPIFFNGVKIALLVPTTISISLRYIFKYSSYFSPFESPL